MTYSDIYFAVASISTIAVMGLFLLCLIYVLSILYDIKRLSKIARREAEFIARSFAKGASVLGNELSQEAAGFLKTLFSVLFAQFAQPKTKKVKREKISSI